MVFSNYFFLFSGASIMFLSGSHGCFLSVSQALVYHGESSSARAKETTQRNFTIVYAGNTVFSRYQGRAAFEGGLATGTTIA